MKTALLVLASLASLGAHAAAVSPTELGAFLAGRQLPPGSPLAPLQDSAEYREHARQYAAQWYRYDDLYFAPMRSWSATELSPRIGTTSHVTYLFGGPDLVSALALFPSANFYALGGLEPVGKLTNPLALTPEELHASLAMLRKSTEIIMNFSHFITKDMKTELASSHFQGVFPIMLVFLSFTDARIDLAERLTLQRDGTLSHGESGDGQPALRIVFRSAPGAPPAEAVYVQANVADSALKSNPPFSSGWHPAGRPRVTSRPRPTFRNPADLPACATSFSAIAGPSCRTTRVSRFPSCATATGRSFFSAITRHLSIFSPSTTSPPCAALTPAGPFRCPSASATGGSAASRP